jgi:hypothetical protein
MLSLLSLWLPIVVAAVVVFIASSIVHMALPWHKKDMIKVPKEDEVRAALGKFAIPPGDYGVPHASSMKEGTSPEFTAKLNEGPVLFMSVAKNGPPNMALSFVLWFFYLVAVSKVAALVATLSLAPGAAFLPVFRVIAAVAFAGYSLALLQRPIWYGGSWWTTIKSMIDGLLYALLTGAVFGWLWPR